MRVHYSIFTSQFFLKNKMLYKWLALIFWLPWKGLPLGENLMGMKTINHHLANPFHPSCTSPPSHIVKLTFQLISMWCKWGKQKLVSRRLVCCLIKHHNKKTTIWRVNLMQSNIALSSCYYYYYHHRLLLLLVF